MSVVSMTNARQTVKDGVSLTRNSYFIWNNNVIFKIPESRAQPN